MIETYKIVTGKYGTSVAPSLAKAQTYVTRGNKLRLTKDRSIYDLRKHYFIDRIVNIWNSLLNCVVTANITNVFKKSYMILTLNCKEPQTEAERNVNDAFER